MNLYRILIYSSSICLSSLLFSCTDSDDGFNPVSSDTYTDEILNFEEPSAKLSKENELEATFLPVAGNAVTFDVFFGDVDNEQPTFVKAGEAVTHTYPAKGSYIVKFIATSITGKSGETSKPIAIGLLKPLELKFESDKGFFSFGVEFSIVNNPFKEGTNKEDTKVGEFKKSAASFQGIGYQLVDSEGKPSNEPLIDFNGSNKNVKIKIYSKEAVPIALIFQDGTNGERGVEGNASHTGTGWETLDIDYSKAKLEFIPNDADNGAPTVATARYTKFVLFINGPSDQAQTSYIDDLIQEPL